MKNGKFTAEDLKHPATDAVPVDEQPMNMAEMREYVKTTDGDPTAKQDIDLKNALDRIALLESQVKQLIKLAGLFTSQLAVLIDREERNND